MNSMKRVHRLFEQIDHDPRIVKKPDTMVLANSSHPYVDLTFFYITGFPDGLFERNFLVARREGQLSLFTTPLEAGNAQATTEIDIHSEPDVAAIRIKMKEYASAEPSRVVGVNSTELTLEMFNLIKSVYDRADLIDISEPIKHARAVKDDAEIECMKKSCNIASKIYRKIPDMLHEGLSESQLAAKLAFEMQNSGGSGLAFDSIVGFGRNSAKQHYTPTNYRLRKNQLVIMDYGTKYKRYCSDITRTLVFGKASKEHRKVYDIVLEALKVGVENCIAGNRGSDVDAKVAAVINSTQYKGRFIHSTGHSLGLSVHEGDFLAADSDVILEPGMVVTVEPGIYLPQLGGVRIEDDVLVTKGTPMTLTSASRELHECE